MYALGLAEMYSKEYWVEIETVDQTPDTRVHHIDQSAGHNEIGTQHIEIVDWEEHVDDALDLIKQKCRRAYPPYFCLLLLARNGKNFDVGDITRRPQGGGATRRLVLSFADEPDRREDHVDAKFAAGIL